GVNANQMVGHLPAPVTSLGVFLDVALVKLPKCTSGTLAPLLCLRIVVVIDAYDQSSGLLPSLLDADVDGADPIPPRPPTKRIDVIKCHGAIRQDANAQPLNVVVPDLVLLFPWPQAPQ